MGRPRRLSLAFLKQERQKLEAYRYTRVAGCMMLVACIGHTKAYAISLTVSDNVSV
jgi:hypothetical protein